MKSLLLVILTLFTTQLLSQQNEIANFFHWGDNDFQNVLGNDSLIIHETHHYSILGDRMILRKLDNTLNVQKELDVRFGVMAKLDDFENVFTLSTSFVDFDIAFNPAYVVFNKFDRNLDTLFSINIDSISLDNNVLSVGNGGFCLFDDFVLFAFLNHRIKIDLESGQILSHAKDTAFLFEIRSMEQLNDSMAVVQSGNSIYILNQNGIILNEVSTPRLENIIVKNQMIYGANANNFYEYNDNLEITNTFQNNTALFKTSLNHDGQILVGAKNKLLSLNQATFELNSIFENIYSDSIYSGFIKNNEILLYGNENAALPNSFSKYDSEFIRFSTPVDVSQLPDVGIKYVQLEVIPVGNSSSGMYQSYTSKINLTLENYGNSPIQDVFVIIEGKCNFWATENCYSGMVPINILPGENETLIFEDEYANSTFEKDYSNNSSCVEFDINTATEEFTNDSEINIFPNPSLGIFTIDYSSSLDHWEVFSLGRQLILEGSNSTVNLSEKSPGIYFIKITSKDGSYQWKKLIKN